jgi:hypothetical protein
LRTDIEHRGGKLTSTLIGVVDQRTAQRVGQMLASDDPSVLTTGIRAIANSRLRMDALRNLDTRLAALLASRQGAAATPCLMERRSGGGSN